MTRANSRDSGSRPVQAAVAGILAALRGRGRESLQRNFRGIVLGSIEPAALIAELDGLRQRLGRLREAGPIWSPERSQAIVPLRFERGQRDLHAIVDRQGRIQYLRFLAHRRRPPVRDTGKTRLSLPFEGRWLVFWGGDTPATNAHIEVAIQRYAVDFVVVDDRGRSHRGEGRRNSDNFSFGRTVQAAAPGTVCDVIDGVRDNPPGQMNPYSAVGNAVLIRHAHGEVSLAAHLQQGSIAVAVGQRVARGQAIARCGNSGNTSAPHLHFHLQNTPVFTDAKAMRPVFRNVLLRRDGREVTVATYSPRKGDLVAPG